MARTESMSRARMFLVRKYGESYGQTQWAWMLQRYGLMPWDEVSNEMRRAVYGA